MKLLHHEELCLSDDSFLVLVVPSVMWFDDQDVNEIEEYDRECNE